MFVKDLHRTRLSRRPDFPRQQQVEVIVQGVTNNRSMSGDRCTNKQVDVVAGVVIKAASPRITEVTIDRKRMVVVECA